VLADEPVADVRSKRAEVPAPLAAVAAHALARDPSARFPTAGWSWSTG